jgi:hypothetical protein
MLVTRIRAGAQTLAGGFLGAAGHAFCATVLFLMASPPQNPTPQPGPGPLYCPNCAEEVNDPLTCGDCSSVICRRCGTALESSDELGIG